MSSGGGGFWSNIHFCGSGWELQVAFCGIIYYWSEAEILRFEVRTLQTAKSRLHFSDSQDILFWLYPAPHAKYHIFSYPSYIFHPYVFYLDIFGLIFQPCCLKWNFGVFHWGIFVKYSKVNFIILVHIDLHYFCYIYNF